MNIFQHVRFRRKKVLAAKTIFFIFVSDVVICKIILHYRRRAMVTRCDFFSTGVRRRLTSFFYFTCNHGFRGESLSVAHFMWESITLRDTVGRRVTWLYWSRNDNSCIVKYFANM